MPTPRIVCSDLIPVKIKHVIPFLVYFKCCLSHVRTKFFPQHKCSGNDKKQVTCGIFHGIPLSIALHKEIRLAFSHIFKSTHLIHQGFM